MNPLPLPPGRVFFRNCRYNKEELSAPWVIRTPDLQVRSALLTVRVYVTPSLFSCLNSNKTGLFRAVCTFCYLLLHLALYKSIQVKHVAQWQQNWQQEKSNPKLSFPRSLPQKVGLGCRLKAATISL